MSAETWLVVGLGNPGERYAHTRHNLGIDTVQALALSGTGTSFGLDSPSFKRHKTGAFVCEQRPLILAVLGCYMNVSGGAAKALANYYGLSVENLLVVHDELDLPLGKIRLKKGGSEGGHNGLKSISQAFSSRDYTRVRLGIGRPPGRQDPADYVLRRFIGEEKTEAELMVQQAVQAIELVTQQGLLAAQQIVHSS